MQEIFPVNSGNVPPPSQSTNLLSHQLSFNSAFQLNNNNNNNNNLRRNNKIKNVKPVPKVVIYKTKKHKIV